MPTESSEVVAVLEY